MFSVFYAIIAFAYFNLNFIVQGDHFGDVIIVSERNFVLFISQYFHFPFYLFIIYLFTYLFIYLQMNRRDTMWRART